MIGCKDYGSFENQRNKSRHKLFTEALKKAFGEGNVLIAHHLCFGDAEEPNEIPSADTLLFDHDIMSKIFGDNHVTVMVKLAKTPVPDRDDVFKNFLETIAV